MTVETRAHELIRAYVQSYGDEFRARIRLKYVRAHAFDWEPGERDAYDRAIEILGHEQGKYKMGANIRRKNPQPRKKPAKRAKSYITRPSQTTRAAPSKRLKARRAKVASGAAPKGYFPNPDTRHELRMEAAESVVRAEYPSKSEYIHQAAVSYAHGYVTAARTAGALTSQEFSSYLNRLRAVL